MVVNAPESPVQAEVVFVIEATTANGCYIGELKSNYIIPTLEYFHGGELEQGNGGGSVYSVVTYKTADCHPGVPVATYGPFTCPQNVVEIVDQIQFIGGHANSHACVTEALATALGCLEEIGRTDIPMHILLLCSSPPFAAYGGGLVPPGMPATWEQAARLVAERGVQLSLASARRLPMLAKMYELAGGDLMLAQQRNYAKDQRHLVLVRGYSLKERPPSPAPPPAPDVSADVYTQPRIPAAASLVSRGPGPPVPSAGGPASTVGPPGACGAYGRGGRWLAPARPVYAGPSALLTQLAQPSYPPPPQQQQQRLPGMVPAAAAPLQRSFIWSGLLEWIDKPKGDQAKTARLLPCQVSANSKDIEPELKADTWPDKLLMQLMPKQLISNIGGQYLKDSKSVLFHLQQNENMEALTKLMVNGYAGCVHFSLPTMCDIKVLILLYTPDKKAYLGFIPNNQATFVDRLRQVIKHQKQSQNMGKQMPAAGPSTSMAALPSSTITGQNSMQTAGMSTAGMSSVGMTSSGMGGGPGMGQMGQVGQVGPGQVGQQAMPGPNQQMQQGQVQQHGQGMMMGQMQPGVQGSRSVNQLDGLEAARQHNLEKIQQLQQTLDAAHQQEAQFKSQMDIMSHLHAAQQQEMTYKQLEEQRKHLQAQQMQQLRGAAGHAPRVMRPMMPSNPGLRHLLQQQPYRPGVPRPPSQPQQFDDVNNYDFI